MNYHWCLPRRRYNNSISGQCNCFDGECNLEHNHAENGGAIHSTESKLYMNDNVTIAHKMATGNGGGVYLSTIVN